MSDRDTGDVALAELGGDIKMLGAQLDGISKVFTSEVSGLRRQIEGLDERLSDMKTSIEQTGKLARRAIAESTENREASIVDLRDVERRIDARLRALELKPDPSPFSLTRGQKTAIIAIIGAVASALGFTGGAVREAIKDPPALESKQ